MIEGREIRTALITGVAGSGGSYLAEHLVRHTDVEVHGLVRWHSAASAENLSSVAVKENGCG